MVAAYGAEASEDFYMDHAPVICLSNKSKNPNKKIEKKVCSVNRSEKRFSERFFEV
jgi:hypothetical protein